MNTGTQHSLSLRPVLVASCIACVAAVGATTLTTFLLDREVRTALARAEQAHTEEASRFAQRLDSVTESLVTLEASVHEAVEQLPVRMAVIDPATGTSAPVLRANLRDADVLLAGIECAVSTIPEDRLPVEDARAICESVRGIDRVGLAALGADIRERVERLCWVAEALEHLASQVGDMPADIMRSRALAADPRNCSPSVSAHLGARIESVRHDGEVRMARATASGVARELDELVVVADPLPRLRRLESLADRVAKALVKMADFEASTTQCIREQAAAVDVAIEAARADARRAEEIESANSIAAVFDARIASIDATADARDRALLARRLKADAGSAEADFADAHDAARALVRQAVVRIDACAVAADRALEQHRADRHRAYVGLAEFHIGAYERAFRRADWKWLSWGIDEDSIVTAFCDHVAIIDPSGLPAGLRGRHERAIASAFEKVDWNQTDALRFALSNRSNKAIHPE